MTAAAKQAARLLVDRGIRGAEDIHDPLDPVYADVFVEALAAGLAASLRGVGRDIVDGAGRFVRSTNAERDHGLFEVLQNADDLDAGRLSFQPVEGDDGGRWLRVAHNGTRVHAPDVLAMTLALITTKTDEDTKTGKFGAGLGTLVRMADSFTVHSWPYAFEVRNQQLSLAERAAPVPGMYDPERPDTLLVLHLQDNYPLEAFERWFEAFEPESLLFLNSVRSVALLDGTGTVVAERTLTETSRKTTTLDLGDPVDAAEVVLVDKESGREWTRVSVMQRVPKGVTRTDKKTPRSTPVALAFDHAQGPGHFYASLPLAIPAKLPFSVNGQFDTESRRTDLLQGEGWNEWLLDRATALAGAVARQRFATMPAEAWGLVPLAEEIGTVEDPWLAERLTGLVEAVLDELREKAVLPLADGTRLAELCFEAADLEGVLTADDLLALTEDATPLPVAMRDRDGRWRRVLDELDVGLEVGVDAAIDMLEWSDTDLGERSGRWFVLLAASALEGDLDDELEELPCLLLQDGQRLSPRQAVARGLVLARDEGGDPLGRRLGLIQPLAPAFYGHTEAARSVLGWLRRDVGVRTTARSDETLRALAKRDYDEPLMLDDGDLRALFDAFRAEPELAEQLGKQIGKRVLVDGKTWVRGKQKSLPVRPAEAYLPRSSWARAAGKTEGLFWLTRYYGRALHSAEGRRRQRGMGEAGSQAAQRFFRQLGAELAPRLVPRPTNDQRYGERAAKMTRWQLTATQREALDEEQPFSGLMNDHLSPDLQAVLDNIARDRVADARERAQQLINAMDRAWKDLYAGHEDAEAVWAYYEMQRQGTVPATWRARAAETQWMTNESGRRRQPRELAVRTPAFVAFLREAPHKYAYGLDARQASTHVVRALGFETEPKVDTLIDRLEELRAQELSGKRIDAGEVEKCYETLASMSPNPEARGRARRIGDEPISSVRRRFVRGKLVRAGGEWVAPSGVFIGKPIFHQHARFVPASAERLWLLLNMRRPDIRDCIDVLEIVAQLGPPDADQSTLIETYRLIEAELSEGAKAPRALQRLPLWTTAGWRSQGRIYAVRDETLAVPLGKHVPVWLAPVPVGQMPALMQARGVTLLDEASFAAQGINSGSRSAGSSLDPQLQLTLKHLQEWLAVHNGDVHDRVADSIGWDALVGTKVALNSRLQVDVPIPDYGRVMVPRAAHLQLEPEPILGIATPKAIESAGLMAGLLRSAIGAEEMEWHVLVHGWAAALDLAQEQQELTGLRLSENDAEADGQAVTTGPSSIGLTTTKTPGRTTGATRGSDDDAAGATGESEPTPIRPFKDLDDIAAEVELVTAPAGPEPPQGAPTTTNEASKTLKSPRRGKRVSAQSGNGRSRRQRSDPDRELLGLQLVAREAARLFGARQLDDVRDQGDVGADAVDEAGRYYELKAHSRDIPPQITLEPSEFDRAREEGEKYILCIVGGLEEGQDTVVRFIPDPIRRLPWWTTSDITVGGLREAASDDSSSEAA